MPGRLHVGLYYMLGFVPLFSFKINNVIIDIFNFNAISAFSLAVIC